MSNSPAPDSCTSKTVVRRRGVLHFQSALIVALPLRPSSRVGPGADRAVRGFQSGSSPETPAATPLSRIITAEIAHIHRRTRACVFALDSVTGPFTL
jgi:hypothetical protein